MTESDGIRGNGEGHPAGGNETGTTLLESGGELKYHHTVLVVDDEEFITRAMKRLFRKDGYTVLTACSGEEALDQLREGGDSISLVISDQRMPGMSGSELLEKVRTLRPETARFLLTGYSDMDAIVDAVNRGGIHRYMSKPWDDDELRRLAREFLHRLELARENRRLHELTDRQNRELIELNRSLEAKVEERTEEIRRKNEELHGLNVRLESSFLEAVRLLSAYVETRNPRLGRHMRKVARLARETAADVGISGADLDDIEIAGMYHDIAFIGLPEKLWLAEPDEVRGVDSKSIREHPVIASMALQSVDRLQKAAGIVLHHHERLDGGGFPEGIKGGAVPPGASIVGAAADYCKVIETGPRNPNRIITMAGRLLGTDAVGIAVGEPEEMLHQVAERLLLRRAHKWYGIKVVAKLLERVRARSCEDAADEGKEQMVIDLDRLEPGMTLARDLRLSDGRLLLLGGTELSEERIRSIQNLGRSQLIKAHVFV